MHARRLCFRPPSHYVLASHPTLPPPPTPLQVMAIKSRHSGKLRDFKAPGAQYVEG